MTDKLEPVWVHNLRSFIDGKFPPGDAWRALFRENFDKQCEELDALRSELEAVKREAVAVVKPFAEDPALDDRVSDDAIIDLDETNITVGLLRRARAFMEKHGNG